MFEKTRWSPFKVLLKYFYGSVSIQNPLLACRVRVDVFLMIQNWEEFTQRSRVLSKRYCKGALCFWVWYEVFVNKVARSVQTIIPKICLCQRNPCIKRLYRIVLSNTIKIACLFWSFCKKKIALDLSEVQINFGCWRAYLCLFIK